MSNFFEPDYSTGPVEYLLDFHPPEYWFILTGKFHDLRTNWQITAK